MDKWSSRNTHATQRVYTHKDTYVIYLILTPDKRVELGLVSKMIWCSAQHVVASWETAALMASATVWKHFKDRPCPWTHCNNHGWQSEICCQKEHRSSRRTSARISKTCRGKFFFFSTGFRMLSKAFKLRGWQLCYAGALLSNCVKVIEKLFFHQFYPHKLMNL